MTPPIKLIGSSYATPKRANPKQFLRNGMAPSAALDSQLAIRINHLMRHKRKLLFMHGIDHLALPAGSAGTSERLRFRFMTGTGAVGIRIRAAVMARATSSSSPSGIQLALTDIVAATTNTTVISCPNVVPAGFGANELAYVDQVIACDEQTVYELIVSDVDYARVMSISGSDVAGPVSDDHDYYMAESSSVGRPILASRHHKMRDIINNMYVYNGPQLISFARHQGAETASTNSTSYVLVHPASCEYRFDLTNVARRNRTTVPVVFGAIGTFLGGNHDVALFEGANNKGSVNLTTTNTWVTTSFDLDALDLDYTLKFKASSALNTLSLKAVFCYVYDP